MAKQSLKYRDEDRSLDLYLREIGETPLINADEEVRLARKIKQGDKKALEKSPDNPDVLVEKINSVLMTSQTEKEHVES